MTNTNNMEKIIIIGAIIIMGTLSFIYALARGLGKVTDVDWEEIEKTHDMPE